MPCLHIYGNLQFMSNVIVFQVLSHMVAASVEVCVTTGEYLPPCGIQVFKIWTPCSMESSSKP